MLALFALLAPATLELTSDNFDKEIFASGKSGFVKFLAPWYAAASPGAAPSP